MAPLFIGSLGPTELLIILAIVLLLFGGARLAGLGKSTGRALREFKEETKGLKGEDAARTALPHDAAAGGTSVPPVASTGTTTAGSGPVVEQPAARYDGSGGGSTPLDTDRR